MSMPSSVTAAPRIRISGSAAAAAAAAAAASSSFVGLDDLCGPLFRRSIDGSSSAGASAAAADLHSSRAVDARLQVCQEVDTGLAQLARDLHESRLREMRQLARDLVDDKWRYTNVESLIGGN
ncbi:hypothetical protein BOX15_Mlig014907g1 [Macrostomum lignano]|uniref:Uncharacterized protein n=1 Tax=Macrostomum lignano TaxID=282301 RepID=A0A267GWK7_9PLAT|nr:hypothetical protein BOX15_Mlig014907g1 [Macrostomum lignano]